MARPKGGSAHFVYGVCTNLDKDGNGTPCPKCTSKEIIKLSAHADFVCPECGDSLKKVEPPKDWKKPIIIGCAAAAVLGGVVGAYFALFSGGGAKGSVALNKTTAEVFVGDVDTLKAIVKPEDAGYTLRWASNNPDVATVDNGIVTFHSNGEVKIGVQVNENKELKAFCDYKVDGPNIVLTNWISIMDGKNLTLKVGENKTLSLDCDPGNATEPVNWSSSNESAATVDGTGTVTAVGAGTATITATTTVKKNTASIEVTVKSPGGSGDPGELGEIKLPYGTYTGASKNGKPHGVGRLVYSKAMVINSHDPKKRMAQPGESVQGEFVNGEITIGKHFDASGNLIQSLNFGVAP